MGQMMALLDDEGIHRQPLAQGKRINGVVTVEPPALTGIFLKARRLRALATERQERLSQAQIDGREPGWEEKSNTTNARVARLYAKSERQAE